MHYCNTHVLVMHKYIRQVVSQQNLTQDEAARACQIIANNGATPAQIATLLTALHIKGETEDEIIGFVEAVRNKLLRIDVPSGTIDLSGTGGTHRSKCNISTIASFIVAACGVKVAKHGVGAMSSQCGSSDVLRELGVNVNPQSVEKCLHEIGICFLFAPSFNRVGKYMAPIRKDMGIRTIFNIVNPINHPGNLDYRLMGCFSKELLVSAAKALNHLGIKRGWVVHSEDGMDEISARVPTYVVEFNHDEIRQFILHPTQFNYDPKDKIECGNPKTNAVIARDILMGRNRGIERDSVLINAAAALVVANKADNIDIGIKMAQNTIYDNSALEKLNQLIEKSADN